MSSNSQPRALAPPTLSRKALLLSVVGVISAVIAVVIGAHVYQRLTTNTVVAYFTETLSLFPGDKVQIMGVEVGSVDSIEPAGNKMRVVLHYANKFKVPAQASASILNPSLVASRTVQLSPPYEGGPVLRDNAVIDTDRTQVPVEFDELRNTLNRLLTGLGPTPQQPKGPFGEVIESAADGLADKGRQINQTFQGLSDALVALNHGRADLFGVVKNLALFVNALRGSDQQFVALNDDLAKFTGALDNSGHELSDSAAKFNRLLGTVRSFLSKNGEVTTADVNNLSDTTTAILQPAPRAGLENTLHVLPTFGANFVNIYSPTNGALTAIPVVDNFANPMQLLCSTIQAGSRLGYQDSAELCAQYLAPILDAIKFNFPPFGANLFTTASTLPKYVTYSEERLRPPSGYKDTTVPGIFSRDTAFSHGNHEPGWVTAPGMQGTQVQPFTAAMLSPESLAGLIGGPDTGTQDRPPLPAEEGR